jgi:hypothetical protein
MRYTSVCSPLSELCISSKEESIFIVPPSNIELIKDLKFGNGKQCHPKPKLKLVTNAKEEVEIENTIRALFIFISPTNEEIIFLFFQDSIVSYRRYFSSNIIIYQTRIREYNIKIGPNKATRLEWGQWFEPCW